MTIICGMDFSDGADNATRAAGALARRLGVPLKLVHVIAESTLPFSLAEPEAREELLQGALDAKADNLRALFSIDVETVLLRGRPDERLTAYAASCKARLLVVSSLGMKAQQHWLVGSVAERVAQRSEIPVLVVRDAAGIEAWAREERALRVMVGTDLGTTSMGALRWVAGLRRLLACDVCIAQIAWPIGEHARLGIKGQVELEGLRPEVQEVLERELREWTGALEGRGTTTFVVRAGWGRIDSHLAQLATELGVDVLVVGTHQRAWAARAWQGSVSRGAIHYATSNVACVPPSWNATGELPVHSGVVQSD
ncbi:MAG: universal stress protein [Polyangiaceae bacterium]